MWKHKEKGFTVYMVRFENGWAYFRSSGINDIMDEVKFRKVYELVNEN